MLATEIIKGLKRKIRIMWVIIIILSLLLVNSTINCLKFSQKKNIPCRFVSTESYEKQVYDVPGEAINKKAVSRKRSKKGNAE